METQQPKFKTCIRCDKEKPSGEFHKDKNSPDGLREYCRECLSVMRNPPNSIEDYQGEEWKDIEDFKGVYFISNYGRLKHVLNPLRHTLRVPYPAPNGYLRLVLSHNNKRKTISIHREVAKAFVPNPNNYKTVNHKDFDKTNNKVSNLEWLSIKDNIIHAKENGKNNRKPILQCDMNGNVIREWESAWAVQLKLGYFSTLISSRCRGIGKSYKGYKWRFKL
jgi:hypothetical protein